MSKIIKMTSKHIDEIRREFEMSLRGAKLSDGKINYTKSFASLQRKATLYFTELAYLKMMTLVREFDKEVAWHGIVKRSEDTTKDEYIISDILVYPQEVTGATVNTNQEKYQMWLMNHDDEVFNNIRMQGHSHVNMSTTPSSVDISLYERILDQMDDDMFYIFLIWNKRNEKTIKIYDLYKNVLFETADVTVSILDDGTGIECFLRDAREMVQDKKYTSTIYGGYGGYYSTSGNIGGINIARENNSGNKVTVKTEKKEQESKQSNVSGFGITNTGRRKKKRKKNNSVEQDDYGQISVLNDYFEDEENPYGVFGYR